MTYDPDRHHRHSIRLQGYDYSHEGVYFVTLCTLNCECLFGKVVGQDVTLNQYGEMVQEAWQNTETIRPNVSLDAFVVMPNHLHGIIVLVGATRRVALPNSNPPKGPLPGSIGAIIGQFKSTTTKQANRVRGVEGPSLWQRNYYEHVIRNERALNKVREYIENNPLRWAEDQENPVNWKRNFPPVGID